jgi:hypothetical protein
MKAKVKNFLVLLIAIFFWDFLVPYTYLGFSAFDYLYKLKYDADFQVYMSIVTAYFLALFLQSKPFRD